MSEGFYHIPNCFPSCPCYLSGSQNTSEMFREDFLQLFLCLFLRGLVCYGFSLVGSFLVLFLTEIGMISFIPLLVKLNIFGIVDKIMNMSKFQSGPEISLVDQDFAKNSNCSQL